jgi:hypothetical protein
MKAEGRLLFLACALVALLALPIAAASAKPGPVIKPKSLSLSLPLPASDGYFASIETEGHRKVSLRVSKGGISGTYVALGRVSRKGIEADFGDFGQVSLRFKPKSRFTPRGPLAGFSLPSFLRQTCKGKRSVGERGLFQGDVSFKGEGGYTQIAAHRLKGKVVRTYRRVCRGGFDPSRDIPGLREEAVVVGAAAQGFGVQRYLLATEISVASGGEELTSAIAFGGERKKVGPVSVTKVGIVIEEAGSLEISPAGNQPVTAEVTIGKPFEGTASYLREGKGPPSWTGTLAVRLPDSGLVSLAGPEFEAELCRASGKAGFSHCIDSVLSGLSFAQGSGSHSQPLALARLSSLR